MCAHVRTPVCIRFSSLPPTISTPPTLHRHTYTYLLLRDLDAVQLLGPRLVEGVHLLFCCVCVRVCWLLWGGIGVVGCVYVNGASLRASTYFVDLVVVVVGVGWRWVCVKGGSDRGQTRTHTLLSKDGRGKGGHTPVHIPTHSPTRQYPSSHVYTYQHRHTITYTLYYL